MENQHKTRDKSQKAVYNIGDYESPRAFLLWGTPKKTTCAIGGIAMKKMLVLLLTLCLLAGMVPLGAGAEETEDGTGPWMVEFADGA